MMKYYIIDDDIAIIKTLENIIKKYQLGQIVGYSTEPAKAVAEVKNLQPDVVLVDLLMSGIDGIETVLRLKEPNSLTKFIMISKVGDKDMIGDAYAAGVDFFINKPLNVIEIKRVLENINNVIANEKKLRNIEGILGNIPPKPSPLQEEGVLSEVSVVAAEASPELSKTPAEYLGVKASLKSIKLFLSNLGIVGEKGLTDILKICEYILSTNGEWNKETLAAVAEEMGDTTKNVEQRVRRTIKKGLTNVATIALDDFNSEIVDYYGSYVYDFISIKEEMEFLKGHEPVGGRIKISRFIEGLLTYIEE